jgi:phospholipase C
MPSFPRRWFGPFVVVALAAAVLVPAIPPAAAARTRRRASTKTPVKHLVVIFQENVSYDHYFGTYPKAKNPPGEPAFHAESDTPHANGLTRRLLNHNPNAANPVRFGHSQLLTCDMNHEYTAEQEAANGGKMDRFVEATGTPTGNDPTGKPCDAKQVMGYYDGNSVTALWNYAQHFAMNDNSFGTVYGPSTVGALNLVSGQTHGVIATATPGTSSLTGEIENGTVIGDPQPLGDDCSTRDQVRLGGKNIGNLLNDEHVTWGFFEGGFKPTVAYDPVHGAAKAVCGSKHNIGAAIGGAGQWGTKADYIPHHQPFQYYESTANPHHLAPTSAAAVGHTDQANHQYDMSDFWNALEAGNFPAVNFLKAPGYQDGHAFYSDPVDEQAFLADTINRLQRRPEWRDTAVVIAYDDSDGWYDHVFSPLVNGSTAPSDALTGPGHCGAGPSLGVFQDRCGYGPRQPLLVISPWARENFVDHTLTDQTSVLRFIEDNWSTGRVGNASFDEYAGKLTRMFDFGGEPRSDHLILDPTTGVPGH